MGEIAHWCVTRLSSTEISGGPHAVRAIEKEEQFNDECEEAEPLRTGQLLSSTTSGRYERRALSFWREEQPVCEHEYRRCCES